MKKGRIGVSIRPFFLLAMWVWRGFGHGVWKSGPDDAGVAKNPAVFRENPADSRVNPAVFDKNPAGMT